jgi:hypothetical protein
LVWRASVACAPLLLEYRGRHTSAAGEHGRSTIYRTIDSVKTGFTIVSPYGTEEGIAYGEGRGSARGRIEGTVVWSNYPRPRTDGRVLPNLRGLISNP